MLTQSFRKSFFFQILCGIAYCHANLVLHRDLKPCNILVTESGRVKLTDFGLGRTYNVPMPPYSPGVVTLMYRAPEICLGLPTYTPAVDVWSAGCILAEMLTGRILFNGNHGGSSSNANEDYMTNCMHLQLKLQTILICLLPSSVSSVFRWRKPGRVLIPRWATNTVTPAPSLPANVVPITHHEALPNAFKRAVSTRKVWNCSRLVVLTPRQRVRFVLMIRSIPLLRNSCYTTLRND